MKEECAVHILMKPDLCVNMVFSVQYWLPFEMLCSSGFPIIYCHFSGIPIYKMCKTAQKLACKQTLSREMATFLELPEEAFVVDRPVLAVVSVWSLRGASGGKTLLCDYTAPSATTKPVTRCWLWAVRRLAFEGFPLCLGECISKWGVCVCYVQALCVVWIVWSGLLGPARLV